MFSLQSGRARWNPLSFLPEQLASSPSAAGLGYRPGAGETQCPPPRQGAWLPPDQPLRDTAVPPGRDDTLDVETDAYIHCVSAFVKLAQSEYQLLMDVIPEHHQKKTFDSLIQVLPRPALFLGPNQMPPQKLLLQKLELGPDLPSSSLQLEPLPPLWGGAPHCCPPLRHGASPSP